MIEKPNLTLGIIPLTDCAPIVVGVEKGFFRDQGLRVVCSREGSWASIRDKVAFGVLDGAQMIAPMPLAATLGVGGVRKAMVTGINLDLNGNAITLSRELFELMAVASDPALRSSASLRSTSEMPVSAHALKRVIDERSAAGAHKLAFGIVFPVSTHNYELRYWLACGGIDPDHDVELVVIPPPRMVDAMTSGRIAGFCVGEPWNTVAVHAGVGRVVATKQQLWSNSPEKVLAVTQTWAEAYPKTHLALIRALILSCRWLDAPEHRAEAARLLAEPRYVGVPAELIARSLTGEFCYDRDATVPDAHDFHVFHRYAANFPWRSHAAWFLTQMRRWGQIDDAVDLEAIAAAVYRPDLYRRAAEDLGVPCPADDEKIEGLHERPWTLATERGPIEMAQDAFIDGAAFDARQAENYLNGFVIRR